VPSPIGIGLPRLLVPCLVLLAAGSASGSHATHPEPGEFSCPVAVRFSPHGGAERVIVSTLRQGRARVHAAIYGLTSPPIEAALADLARAGVRVVLKTDKSQSAGRRQAALLARLHEAGVTVEISDVPFLLHDKFAVVDGRWVITGSFNWTTSAERRNRENVLIFDCPSLAAHFEAEWESIPPSRP
jgi:phosphatidylserine/phosphatidylglycerophosphate/cardiolipin synthase-like enzyme